MHKKRPKICTCCRGSEAKFYLYHSTKIAKAGPGFDDRPEHPSIQINSSSIYLTKYVHINVIGTKLLSHWVFSLIVSPTSM